MGLPYTSIERAVVTDARKAALVEYGFSDSEADNIMQVSPRNPLFYRADAIRSKLANLEAYGFSKEEVREIVVGSTAALGGAEDSVNSKFRNLEAYGFSPEEVRKIVAGLPPVLGLAEESVRSKLKNYEAYGFSKDEVRRIIVGSTVALSLAEDSVNSKLRNLEVYGFTPEEVRKIVAGLPPVLGLGEESVRSKLANLEAYGFDRGEVRKIVVDSSVLEKSEDSVNSKLGNLEKTRTYHNGFASGFSRDEVRRFVLSFPAVLNYSKHNAAQKIRTMTIITEGDKQEMLEMGKNWMQSAMKTVKRARHLQDEGIKWRHNKNIFASAKRFQKKYGVAL